MKIFNSDKTVELSESEIDYQRGYLKPDKRIIAHREATPFIKGQTVDEQVAELTAQGIEVFKGPDGAWHKVIKVYPNGGKESELIIEIPDTPAQSAVDEFEDILVYTEYSAADLNAIASAARIRELQGRLQELDYDINACEDGVIKAKTLEEYRAERVTVRNELRTLQGKPRLEREGEA